MSLEDALLAARSRWKPAVTVTAIIERAGKFLVIREHTAAGLRYNSPAGHLEPGESLVQACKREVLEESAFEFEPQGVIGIYLSRFCVDSQDKTFLRVAFYGRLGKEYSDRELDTGIISKHWFSAIQLQQLKQQLRTPMLLQNVQDYLAGKRFPLDVLYTHESVFNPLTDNVNK